ncbi:hypothetical protein GCM10009547_10950 [Sporichthya brevicatena]|uniref:Ribbon-helix-helix protein CopG domain-containing protein n=2 Tax=Sporichthya brevicatena TaxID=171442 RepID=A0ABN1GFY7_9ACTN
MRRVVVNTIIGSFSLAALLGIIALLGGGDFGKTEVRVLLTTLVVGVQSVAALCYLSLADSPRYRWVGVAGGAISLVCSVIALILIWGGEDSEPLLRAFFVTLTVAATLAQTSLLLALAGRERIGPLLGATLAVAAGVAGLIVGPVLEIGSDPGGGYARLLGVLGILDVLGTVVVIATAVFARARADDSPAPPSVDAEPRLLSTALEVRVREAAKERGTSPAQLISDALDQYLR